MRTRPRRLLLVALLGWVGVCIVLPLLFTGHEPAPPMNQGAAVAGLVCIGLLAPVIALVLGRASATSASDRLTLLLVLLLAEAGLALQVWLYLFAPPWAEAVAALLAGFVVVAGPVVHAYHFLAFVRSS